MLDLLRQRQGAQEVAEIIGQRMELEPDLVVAETVARYACPVDGVFAFLDPLLGCAPSIVKFDSPIGYAAEAVIRC